MNIIQGEGETQVLFFCLNEWKMFKWGRLDKIQFRADIQTGNIRKPNRTREAHIFIYVIFSYFRETVIIYIINNITSIVIEMFVFSSTVNTDVWSLQEEQGGENTTVIVLTMSLKALQHPGVLSAFVCSFVRCLLAHLPLCLTYCYWCWNNLTNSLYEVWLSECMQGGLPSWHWFLEAVKTYTYKIFNNE